MNLTERKDVKTIPIIEMNDEQLMDASKNFLLSLKLNEMKTIQEHFLKLERNPTDAELETLAQTWSEHCKHKVFNSSFEYVENGSSENIENLFKETIKKSTKEIMQKENWLVSVFEDNAGIISFNENFDIAFKVETHNHPSALDPYGGASTGVGGVVRDILGVGLGAKPFANTDVFCFALPETPKEKIPKGILHPKRIFKGVRAGVADYGNRLGIPTVNGAIFFDQRYLGNPLVYCGTLGIIPKGFHQKSPKQNDLIVALGARTGRDGIHGATFSSAELSDSTDSSAVQIGNPIEEKKFLDVLLKARDLKLYSSITDCGAGGFSSAVGEMGEETGAEVFLEKVPLKYAGLKPWEIWLSESQERMILSVPEKNIEKLKQLCNEENVEATVIGKFTNDKKLKVFFEKDLILNLDMNFLHKGLPKSKLKAVWNSEKEKATQFSEPENISEILKQILSMHNIASKESTVRLYDHEVQGGTLLKPFMGLTGEAPADSSVVTPVLGEKKAVAVSNSLNPWYGDIDPYWMAFSCVDEAVRNIVATGCEIERIALLDNFCWGSPEKEENLGKLVRTAKGCYSASKDFNAPFISGKDSFYNEFSVNGKIISVPGTLLISAMAVVKDVSKILSPGFKKAENLIYLTGNTFEELGGSAFAHLINDSNGKVPKVDSVKALKSYNALSKASSHGLVKGMHDLSDGGLGVALSEMCFAKNLGAEIDLKKIKTGENISRNDFLLFSESNSRLLVEVEAGKEKEFEKILKGTDFSLIGKVSKEPVLKITGLNGKKIVDQKIELLKNAWRKTLKW